MRCPLCDAADTAPSGFGAVSFEGRRYNYRECRRCGSSACDPMPDADVLARMYGLAYANTGGSDSSVEDPKAPEEVIGRLRTRPSGVFLDFGCGDGSLLASVRDLGWTAVGVEFDGDVVRRAAARCGCVVFHGLEELGRRGVAPVDVVHLGDVVEHLTGPLDVLRGLVSLLNPTGWLMAQGPLEAGPCLFSALLRGARKLRSERPVEMPPYHVLQATVVGQQALFGRAGLTTIDYRVTEVAWPAPATLTADVARRPRSLGLFALRKASQALSSFAPARWGNRYFYVGSVPGVRQAGQ